MARMQPIFFDTITDATADSADRILVCGSDGGVQPATMASRIGVRAVLFNDAGIGLERAGIAGVLHLDMVGMAAVAVDCQSCHIGSATSMAERGRVMVANTVALGLGIVPGDSVVAALAAMRAAPRPTGTLPPVWPVRTQLDLPVPDVVLTLCDTATLVNRDEDHGALVVTGAHGALNGRDPARALGAAPRVVVFNDAGGGLDDAGTACLPVLGRRGIAAVTVSATSARIGDALSAVETGVISALNDPAEDGGAAIGMPLRDWLGGLGRTGGRA